MGSFQWLKAMPREIKDFISRILIPMDATNSAFSENNQLGNESNIFFLFRMPIVNKLKKMCLCAHSKVTYFNYNNLLSRE